MRPIPCSSSQTCTFSTSKLGETARRPTATIRVVLTVCAPFRDLFPLYKRTACWRTKTFCPMTASTGRRRTQRWCRWRQLHYSQLWKTEATRTEKRRKYFTVSVCWGTDKMPHYTRLTRFCRKDLRYWRKCPLSPARSNHSGGLCDLQLIIQTTLTFCNYNHRELLFAGRLWEHRVWIQKVASHSSQPPLFPVWSEELSIESLPIHQQWRVTFHFVKAQPFSDLNVSQIKATNIKVIDLIWQRLLDPSS